MATGIAHWVAYSQKYDRETGEFEVDEADIPAKVERLLFKRLTELTFEPDRCCLRVEYKDGSGFIRHYMKENSLWRVVFSDNIFPDWFPYLFFVSLLMLPVLFWILFWIR